MCVQPQLHALSFAKTELIAEFIAELIAEFIAELIAEFIAELGVRSGGVRAKRGRI